jgi:hypothetical protein
VWFTYVIKIGAACGIRTHGVLVWKTSAIGLYANAANEKLTSDKKYAGIEPTLPAGAGALTTWLIPSHV